MNGSAIARWSNPDVILVATNLLEGQTFLLHAIYQARLSRAIVLLVHVITPDAPEEAPTLSLDHAIHAAQTKLDELAEAFQFEGVVCETIVLTGDPAEQISLVAKSRAVDRVILASRYESGLARMVEASVAEKVMETVDIPVCFIGRQAHPSPACDAPLGGVLCATSLHSRAQAVSFASALAKLNHAHLTLLHVLHTEGMSEQERQLARFAARQRLCESVPTEARRRDHTDFLIREGDPALIILAEALSRSQDFVILGSHHNQMASRVQMNGVVRRVINESQSPVITINSDSTRSTPEIHESTSSEARLIHS